MGGICDTENAERWLRSTYAGNGCIVIRDLFFFAIGGGEKHLNVTPMHVDAELIPSRKIGLTSGRGSAVVWTQLLNGRHSLDRHRRTPCPEPRSERMFSQPCCEAGTVEPPGRRALGRTRQGCGTAELSRRKDDGGKQSGSEDVLVWKSTARAYHRERYLNHQMQDSGLAHGQVLHHKRELFPL